MKLLIILLLLSLGGCREQPKQTLTPRLSLDSLSAIDPANALPVGKSFHGSINRDTVFVSRDTSVYFGDSSVQFWQKGSGYSYILPLWINMDSVKTWKLVAGAYLPDTIKNGYYRFTIKEVSESVWQINVIKPAYNQWFIVNDTTK